MNDQNNSDDKSDTPRRSKLSQHLQVDKVLKPPMMRIGNMSMSSWKDVRLPEMLWAILIITHLPREIALQFFREVAQYLKNVNQEYECWNVSHSGIFNYPLEVKSGFFELIFLNPRIKEALHPIILLEKIPDREHWLKTLDKNERR